MVRVRVRDVRAAEGDEVEASEESKGARPGDEGRPPEDSLLDVLHLAARHHAQVGEPPDQGAEQRKGAEGVDEDAGASAEGARVSLRVALVVFEIDLAEGEEAGAVKVEDGVAAPRDLWKGGGWAGDVREG